MNELLQRPNFHAALAFAFAFAFALALAAAFAAMAALISASSVFRSLLSRFKSSAQHFHNSCFVRQPFKLDRRLLTRKKVESQLLLFQSQALLSTFLFPIS